MTKRVFIVSLSVIALASIVTAQEGPMQLGTPDGDPPSVETVCDSKSGAAFGLCNAYCEAMDCELGEDANASATACGRVRDQYMKLTGEDLPCEAVCPCVGAGFDGWDELGFVECEQLGINANGIAADTTGLPVAYADDGFEPPSACGVFEPIFTLVAITEEQALSCISLIEDSCSPQVPEQ